MASDIARPSIPDEIRGACILPEEQIIFASANAVAWTAFRTQASQAQLDQAFLRGSLGPSGQGGVPGGGAAMEGMVRMRRRRQWKANKIDWIILTEQRLLFISKGVPERIFELEPSQIKWWMAAQREARSDAMDAMKKVWEKRGLLGFFDRPKSGGKEPTVPTRLYTISAIETNWHLLRRRQSFAGAAVLLGGVVLLWGLIANGVPIGGWLFVAFAAIVFAARIGPWTGVRLRVALIEYGTPKLMRSLSGWMLSRQDIQLRTGAEAERLVSLLAPRVKSIAEAMAASD